MSAVVQQVTEASDWTHRAGYGPPPPSGVEWDTEWRGPTGQPALESRVSLLNRVIASEILPRLVLSRSGSGVRVGPAPVTTADDTAELLRLILDREVPEAVAFMAILTRRGVTTEALFLGVITDAARALGEMWETDRCDFVQVTISAGRLQQVLRALTPEFQRDAVYHPLRSSVLLLPAPGEQHTCGLVMLGEFFRRSGWHVGGGPATGDEGAALVRASWYDVAGFSIGSDSQVEALSRCIRAVRRASCNRDLRVMVGGPLFLLRPDLALRVGADAAASDAPGAVRQAAGLLAMRAPAA